MGICTEGGEDAGDVGTLKGVGDLYAEESETEVPQTPEFHVWLLFHKSDEAAVQFLVVKSGGVLRGVGESGVGGGNMRNEELGMRN